MMVCSRLLSALAMELFFAWLRGPQTTAATPVAQEAAARICDLGALSEAELSRAEEEEVRAGQIELLQAANHLQVARRQPAQGKRVGNALLRSMRPIMWVHIPKCGTSFVNTLIFSDLCSGIPTTEYVDHAYKFEAWTGAWPTATYCPGSFLEGYPLWPMHTGIGSAFVEGKRNGMVMLRQPEQRLLSDFYDGRFAGDKQLMEYAHEVRGCEVKMFTRRGNLEHCTAEYTAVPVRQEEVQLAKRRLREGMGFVGITDDWNLAICLFNTMFGMTFQEFQFVNTRPQGEYQSQGATSNDRKIPGTNLYNTSILQGYTDKIDNELFAEGVQIFHEELKNFHVSLGGCAAAAKRDGAKEAEAMFMFDRASLALADSMGS